jgi:hypothetical protein
VIAAPSGAPLVASERFARNEAKALRLRQERFDDKCGPMSGGF